MSIWERIFRKSSPIEILSPSDPEIKQLTSILFVDDNEFKVIEILKNNGWINTRLIEDVTNIDERNVREAHIIFVDIHGVGKALGFSNEGLGLIEALKGRYPEKRIIAYSAESKGDRFDEGLYVADSRLKKNTDPYAFLQLVESYSREFFTFEACALRIQEILNESFSIRISRYDTEESIRKIAKRGSLDEKSVAEVFGLSSAGSIASLIGLLLQASQA